MKEKLFILDEKKSFYINPKVVMQFFETYGFPPEVFKEEVEKRLNSHKREERVGWILENTLIKC